MTDGLESFSKGKCGRSVMQQSSGISKLGWFWDSENWVDQQQRQCKDGVV